MKPDADAAPAESPDAQKVTLVIPGRDVAGVIRHCLDAVVPLLERGELEEIVFVDDGSVDETAEIVRSYPVRYIRGEGRGPGAARNLGWRAAKSPLIWFVDADCVAEPDSLEQLVPHLDDPNVAGVGGSYGNMRPDSWLACVIHEEIVARHARMPQEVDHLGSFNVLLRRKALERVDGFDENVVNCGGSAGAEDAELAYRLTERGYHLRFTQASRVGHYHPARLLRYLRTQRHHGYWRVRLYLLHPTKVKGDSYAGFVDYLQPPLAVLILIPLPFLWLPAVTPPVLTGLVLLLLLQLPMTTRMRAKFSTRFQYIGVGFLRAFWRGLGLVQGTLAVAAAHLLLRKTPLPNGAAVSKH